MAVVQGPTCDLESGAFIGWNWGLCGFWCSVMHRLIFRTYEDAKGAEFHTEMLE